MQLRRAPNESGPIELAPNPSRAAAESFDSPIYPGTDGLVRIGLRAASTGFRVVRVLLSSPTGSTDLVDAEVADEIADALRHGRPDRVQRAFTLYTSTRVITILTLEHVRTGQRVTVSRYGLIDILGPVPPNSDTLRSLLKLLSDSFTDER